MDLKERASRVLAQGFGGTNSKRWTSYVEATPAFLDRGEGCYVYDEKGKKYLDMDCSLGAIILGHRHPKVTEAVEKQLKKGTLFSMESPLVLEVAEKIRDIIPCAESVRFFCNGNDATTAAVRIARTWTGNSQVESYGYHGCGDIWTSLTPPAIGVKDKFSIVSQGSDFNAATITICEPIETDDGKARKEWLTEKRSDSKCLIFDEIITGFRVPNYSVASWWRITPDLICLGKACANGFPLSIVAGRSEVMNCGEYFLSATFSGNCISLAACNATLDELRKQNMEEYMFYAKRIQQKFNDICKPINVKIVGYGTRGMIAMDKINDWLLMQELAKAGIFIGKAWFFSIAHLQANIEEFLLNAVSDAVNNIKNGRVRLEGPPPTQTFRR